MPPPLHTRLAPRWEILHKGIGWLTVLVGAANVLVGVYTAHKMACFSKALWLVPAILSPLVLTPLIGFAVFSEVQATRGDGDGDGYTAMNGKA